MKTRFRVLIFDDNEGVRLMAHTLLERRGFDVHTYPDPVFYSLHEHPGCAGLGVLPCADAIVTDLDMPTMNGLDFLRQLTQRGCCVRYLALLVGSGDEGAMRGAAALGCQVFRKPEGLFEMLQWLVAIAAEVPVRRGLLDLHRRDRLRRRPKARHNLSPQGDAGYGESPLLELARLSAVA